MSYQVIFNDSLYHHGIKGQKWGVRRFQNPDGTLTEAGKKKYGKRYEERQSQIQTSLANANYYKKNVEKNEKYLEKSLKNNKSIAGVYRDLFGDDDPEMLGYESKKEAVETTINSWKEHNKSMQKIYENEATITKNTPINKLTRQEMKTVTKGLNRTAFALNTLGAIGVGVLIKKQDGKIDKDVVKALAAMDLLFTSGAAATNSMVKDIVANKREKKILEKENNK